MGITLTYRGKTVFLTSAEFGYGRHGFAVPALAKVGVYNVKLDATDLAGNYSQVTGVVRVSR